MNSGTLAPALALAGLVLMCGSLAVVAVAESETRALVLPPSDEAAANGTHIRAYTLQPGIPAHIRWEFPDRPGDLFVVEGDANYSELRGGLTPSDPVFARLDERSGEVLVLTGSEVKALRGADRVMVPPRDAAALGTGPEVERQYVVLTWDDGEPDNAPHVMVAQPGIEPPRRSVGLLLTLTAIGAAATLGGFLWWLRAPRAEPARPDEASAIEITMRLADVGAAWLERLRRHVLTGGAIAIVAWLIVLVQIGRARSDWPSALGFATLVALGVATILSAREYVRLSRDIKDWRSRVDGLRALQREMVEPLASTEP